MNAPLLPRPQAFARPEESPMDRYRLHPGGIGVSLADIRQASANGVCLCVFVDALDRSSLTCDLFHSGRQLTAESPVSPLVTFTALLGRMATAIDPG